MIPTANINVNSSNPIITVWVNGVVQHDPTDYIVLDNHNIMFNYAPNPGDKVEVDRFASAVDKHHSTVAGDGKRTIFGLSSNLPAIKVEERRIDVNREYWSVISMRRDVSIWFRDAFRDYEGREWYDHERRAYLHSNVICMTDKLATLVVLKWQQ